MQLSISVVDEGLTAAIDIVDCFLQSLHGGISPIQPFTPLEIDLDRSPAASTNHIRVVLKPSKRLLKFVAAARASQIDLSIVKES